ncbi:MAG TPA: hypothetical protein VFH56_07620 [Acidimicrobiales bacterium]|nr:hypothetical protein [Acidimicrobiales bacterium]
MRSRRPLDLVVAAIAGAGVSLFSYVCPAGAAAPPTVSGSIVLVSGGNGSPCVFTVGYQWAGITAHSVELDVDAPNFTAGTLVMSGLQGRSGSVSGNITISDPNMVTYHGFGQILDRRGSPVSGTQVSSDLAGSNQLIC